jgi:hypothetical protein
MEVRNRLSRGSLERHTGQVQPMTGTPCEVPLPKTVTIIDFSVFRMALQASNRCAKLAIFAKTSRHLAEFPYICGMNFLSKIRNRALRRALDQFSEEKVMVKLPNAQKINSMLIILDESDKGIVKSIESSAKALFNTGRCGFIILCNQMSDTILQSDLYTEITPKDFGFMSVLKPEKHEYIKKWPFSNMIINMAGKDTDISDYLCILPKADFRISFQESEYMKIYDLVIENPRATDPVSNIHVLHNYLKALAGIQS